MKKSGSEIKNVVSGAVSLTVSTLIVKLLGMIYKIPLSYILSEEGMGYFNSAYTVYTFFYIISTAGVPRAISILTAGANGDYRRINQIYKTAFIIFFALGSVSSVLLGIFASPIANLIGNTDAAMTMVAIAPSILFICASGVIRGYFSGMMNFIPIAVSEAIVGVVKLVLGIIFAYIGYILKFELFEISALTILGSTLGALFGYLYLIIYKKSNDKSLNLEQKSDHIVLSRGITKEIFKIAIPLTLTSAISAISGVVDVGIIMRRLIDTGYTQLQASILYGNYTTLVIPMLNLSATLIAPASAILLPLVSSGDVKKEGEKNDLIAMIFKIVAFVSIGIAAVFFMYPREILSIIFEDSSAIMATPMLMLIAPGIIFMSLLTVLNTLLEGVGKTHLPMLSLIIGTVLKLILTYVLIGEGEIGILGPSIASVASYFLSFLLSAYFVSKTDKINPKLWGAIISSFSAVVCAILILMAIKRFFSTGNIIISIIEMFVFALLYLLFFLIFGGFKLFDWLKLSKYTKKR